ncbi:protein BEAN1, partial [Plectropomus leopardus]|uniref:protein BEAN1 n=1 Tax=Plectropomus leopardus TaxID=160734 RepID=UPI001C4DAC2F
MKRNRFLVCRKVKYQHLLVLPELHANIRARGNKMISTAVLTLPFCSCLHSYDECVGPGSTQIYIPTDDPPPYSLLDPCQRGAEQEEQPEHSGLDPSPYCGETSVSGAWFSPSHYPLGLQEHEHIASISFPLEAAPPYESVLAEQPLPLMPCDV